MRVLKSLVAKIEAAITDPEEDEISDDLVNHLSILISSELPSEDIALQQKSYVTFTCLTSTTSHRELSHNDPTITLLEKPNLISGALTTGFRTWEAALHLGAWLLLPGHEAHIQKKNVLELGAGTGFLSILCAKHLGANHVTATDGDTGVTEALQENFFLNGLDEQTKIHSSILRWGQTLIGTWVEEDCEAWPYDVVVGADVTYDKPAISALVATLNMLFQMRPTLQVYISATIRNADTFDAFRQACAAKRFNMVEIEYQPKAIEQQQCLFHSVDVHLKIVSIRPTNSIDH